MGEDVNGLGFFELRQSFDEGPVAPGNDIATTARKHRYFYVPLGVYAGSTSPLDSVNIYYQVTAKPLLTGEAKIGRGNAATTMNISGGFGFDFETGFHFPTSSSWNFFTGIYFQQWHIKSSSAGAREIGGVTTVVKDTETDHQEIGIKLGVQF